jgi:hypothetical protein
MLETREREWRITLDPQGRCRFENGQIRTNAYYSKLKSAGLLSILQMYTNPFYGSSGGNDVRQ